MRRDAIERLLPAVFQAAAQADGGRNPMAALLDVMQMLHEPTEGSLAALDNLFAPYRTPDKFMPYLARWVAVEHLGGDSGGIPVARLRDLVHQATTLARWRGTKVGLLLALKLATGVDGFTIEEPRAFHFIIRVPDTAADQLELVKTLVAAEKPAATTCEIIVAPDAEGAPS
ncbi:hypothetical protein Rhe02_03090 [Rhizocola hellebori]|uniref:Phage tail protein n=1 Tax=Rhizocola hellebori TaxID=1392758 RepID=A0A8J3Q2K9_9ACTN|nr:phage tail protein [Rhizocola hellebori]GIH02242.1 hypothetical protein Rhe02_03090 [Rhizocola hellebori]